MAADGLAIANGIKIPSMATTERIPGFGGRVQEVLTEAQLNQTDAMRELGVAYTTVTKWVHGTTTPNVVNLVPLAQLGRVHIEWLITGEGPKYVDESRNRDSDDAARARREQQRAAVETYLASELAADVDSKVAALLRDFDFSMLGIDHPEVKDVHRVRDLMDMRRRLGHVGSHGGQNPRQ